MSGNTKTQDEETKTAEKKEQQHLSVSADNLKDYVGNPLFISDRMYEITPPGVVMGLAWTAMGGSTLYIETVLSPPSKEETGGKISMTGQLGDVMKESVEIAYTFAKVELIPC